MNITIFLFAVIAYLLISFLQLMYATVLIERLERDCPWITPLLR